MLIVALASGSSETAARIRAAFKAEQVWNWGCVISMYEFSELAADTDRNAMIAPTSAAKSSAGLCVQQMDEEKARVEDLLRRGEEGLQQTSDEGLREELRLLLLRLQSQYAACRVRCYFFKRGSNRGCVFFCIKPKKSPSLCSC